MGWLLIPISPAGKDFTNCDAVMNGLFKDYQYDKFSLLQNILCQYIYLARMERYLNCYLCCNDTGCEDNYKCGNLCNIIGGDESPW